MTLDTIGFSSNCHELYTLIIFDYRHFSFNLAALVKITNAYCIQIMNWFPMVSRCDFLHSGPSGRSDQSSGRSNKAAPGPFREFAHVHVGILCASTLSTQRDEHEHCLHRKHNEFWAFFHSCNAKTTTQWCW